MLLYLLPVGEIDGIRVDAPGHLTVDAAVSGLGIVPVRHIRNHVAGFEGVTEVVLLQPPPISFHHFQPALWNESYSVDLPFYSVTHYRVSHLV